MKVVCSYCRMELGKRGCILAEDAVSQDICPSCWVKIYTHNSPYHITLYCEHCRTQRSFCADEWQDRWELDCTFCHHKQVVAKRRFGW